VGCKYCGCNHFKVEQMLKKLNKNNVLVICSFVIMFMVHVTMLLSISCPNMTQTELFLHIPKMYVVKLVWSVNNFYICNLTNGWRTYRWVNELAIEVSLRHQVVESKDDGCGCLIIVIILMVGGWFLRCILSRKKFL
jgi:hypothetical protein